MGLLEMVVRNARSHVVRSALTVIGIGLGIATVIALGAVVQGMRNTAGAFIKLGSADMMVAQKGASDFSFSSLDESVAPQVSEVPGVSQVIPFLIAVDRVGSNSFFLTVGMPARQITSGPVRLMTGKVPQDGTAEVVLGAGTARALGVKSGEFIRIGKHRWRVVGTYSADAKWLSNGAVAPLDTLQQRTSRAGSITGLQVQVEAGEDSAAIGARIERAEPQLSALVTTTDYSKVDQGFAILDAVNAALSVLAVGIGAIGVMNTMFMSVFERTREIGVLRALGWRRRRVLRLVISESLLLCVLGAGLGSMLGVAAGMAINTIDTVAAIMDMAFPASLFARGIAIGLVVGFVGAVFPALRATRLSPMEALRHE